MICRDCQHILQGATSSNNPDSRPGAWLWSITEKWKIFVYLSYITFLSKSPFLSVLCPCFSCTFVFTPFPPAVFSVVTLWPLSFAPNFPSSMPGCWQWLGTMGHSSGSEILRTTECLECYFPGHFRLWTLKWFWKVAFLSLSPYVLLRIEIIKCVPTHCALKPW